MSEQKKPTAGAAYVIGVDYGTDSVRSVLVDTSNGAELASSVFY
jgi:L-ribulokinase